MSRATPSLSHRRHQVKMALVQPAQRRAEDEDIRIGREQDQIELRTELCYVVRHTEATGGMMDQNAG